MKCSVVGGVLSGCLVAVAAGEALFAVSAEGPQGSLLYRIRDPLGLPHALKIGWAGTRLSDLAISPVTGEAYGIEGGTLFGVDLGTGLAKAIGSQAFDAFQSALEFTPDGTLYSWGYKDTRLFRVDPATGAADPVMDLKAWAGGDLAAISDTTLYGTTGLALIKIDLVAGTRTVIGAHGAGLEGDLLYGLELGADGALLGLTGPAQETARMYRIDTQTGAASLVGAVAGVEGLGGYGLAWAVPAPGVVPVVAAMLWPAARRRRETVGG